MAAHKSDVHIKIKFYRNCLCKKINILTYSTYIMNMILLISRPAILQLFPVVYRSCNVTNCENTLGLGQNVYSLYSLLNM